MFTIKQVAVWLIMLNNFFQQDSRIQLHLLPQIPQKEWNVYNVYSFHHMRAVLSGTAKRGDKFHCALGCEASAGLRCHLDTL